MTRFRIALSLAALLIAVAQICSAQTCSDSIVASTPGASFTLHPDGTVTHHTTGLMWMRCALGQSWDGRGCSGTPATLRWQEALQRGEAERFAGYTDWRVPDKNELESILEERCVSPAVNPAVFPATPSSYFWSASPYAGLGHGAWSIDFGYGSVNATVKSGAIHVRLVRGGEQRAGL